MYPLFVAPTNPYLGVDLPGKTVGLIGFGRIGQVMARCCLGFDMEVLVYDPYQEQNADKFPQVSFVPLDALLEQADFVSIHVVLTPETEGMLGERELSLLKPKKKHSRYSTMSLCGMSRTQLTSDNVPFGRARISGSSGIRGEPRACLPASTRIPEELDISDIHFW